MAAQRLGKPYFATDTMHIMLLLKLAGRRPTSRAVTSDKVSDGPDANCRSSICQSGWEDF